MTGFIAGVVPQKLLRMIIEQLLASQKEWEAKSRILDELESKGAVGRSAVLKVFWRDGTITDYYFILETGRVRFVPEGERPPGEPTVTAFLTENTFMDLYQKKYNTMTAWRHERLRFQSGDGDWFLHCHLLMELFEKMRDVTGV